RSPRPTRGAARPARGPRDGVPRHLRLDPAQGMGRGAVGLGGGLCARPRPAPLDLPEAHGTVFLATFDWTLRKGWDVLLSAWCDAFDSHDDVTLVLKVWATSRGIGALAITAETVADPVRRPRPPPRRVPRPVYPRRPAAGRGLAAALRRVRPARRAAPGRGVGAPAGRG